MKGHNLLKKLLISFSGEMRFYWDYESSIKLTPETNYLIGMIDLYNLATQGRFRRLDHAILAAGCDNKDRLADISERVRD